MKALRSRFRGRDGEAGLTLIELLVAAAMSVIVVGAAGSMLISAVRDQPDLSKRAQNISSARWVLERITRELRNGIEVNPATATKSSVSLRTYVRREIGQCGGAVSSNPQAPAIPCQVTYSCTATACSRSEAGPGIESGTATTIFQGIDSSDVFCYVPSANADPATCGPVGGAAPTYVGVTLRIPNPDGSGDLTVSDGASLRNATLSN
jgi:type II secretory pathway pseudopilin PulG